MQICIRSATAPGSQHPNPEPITPRPPLALDLHRWLLLGARHEWACFINADYLISREKCACPLRTHSWFRQVGDVCCCCACLSKSQLANAMVQGYASQGSALHSFSQISALAFSRSCTLVPTRTNALIKTDSIDSKSWIFHPRISSLVKCAREV